MFHGDLFSEQEEEHFEVEGIVKRNVLADCKGTGINKEGCNNNNNNNKESHAELFRSRLHM